MDTNEPFADSAGIVGIDHVQLCCPPGGEAAARAFWTGVVGVPEAAKPAELAARGGCWFRLGAQGLHVGVLDPFVAQVKAHPAIRLQDRAALDALVARLEQAGYAVSWADVPVADARCKVHDPFGNLVELLVGTTG